MSSMWRFAYLLPIGLTANAAGSTQYPTPPQASPAFATAVGYALNDWRRLRSNSGYAFADYAR
ncbi:MAG: hypothetical protein ACREBM_01925, partial [Sphingomicrobium sp.]